MGQRRKVLWRAQNVLACICTLNEFKKVRKCEIDKLQKAGCSKGGMLHRNPGLGKQEMLAEVLLDALQLQNQCSPTPCSEI